jgi:hypothetical protein
MKAKAKKLLDTLYEMKGKQYMYAARTLLVKEIDVDERKEKIIIITDKKVFDCAFDSCEEFLSNFLPLDSERKLQQPTLMQSQLQTVVAENQPSPPANTVLVIQDEYHQHSTLTTDLIAILKDNISRVKENKDFIPQAQAINNNVNSIISVTKLQLEIHRHFRKKPVDKPRVEKNSQS